MAPAQVPLTPEPEAYAPLKTPEERRRVATQPSIGASLVGRAAQLLVLLCMAFYVFGEVLVLTPLYNNKIAKNIQGWWGVPKNQPKGGTKGHSEMVRPTYFTLFSVLPLLVIVLLVDFLRKYNARRLTSQALLKVALVLRRKPALFGRVSYWSYGEWLFFAALVLGNVFVFVRYYVSRVNTKKPKTFNAHLECVGITLGFTCLFNMAFLFLPATRNSAWMEFFNVSYANSVKYHRWLGVVTVLTAFVHCVCYYWVWIREGEWQEQALPCFNCDLSKSKVNKRWQYVFGELAFIIFALMGVTAIPFVRRQFYNLFYYTHQLLFVAVVLLALHWQYTIWWLLPTLVLYCLSRSVSFVNGFSPVEVVEVTALSSSLVKVVFKRSPGRDGAYQVGQFLYLNVPAISKLQWHAFTVASSPRADPTTVTVLLKALGDWTKDLVDHTNECKAKNVLPTVYVDGFYGASLEMYDEYSTVCLVAGGIGVTPILAILRDMVAKLSSGAALQQKVVFIFAFRELALLEEIAPVLAQLRELDPQQRFVSFHLTLTGSVSEDALETKLAGRTASAKVAEPKTDATMRRAFSQPLRATAFTSIAALAAFVMSILLLAILEYGTKIKRLNAKLSLLEWFVEICVVLGAAFVAVFVVVVVERKLVGASREPVTHAVQDLSAPFTLQSLQVHTYRDLLAEFSVAVGAQPDVAALLRQTHAQHECSISSHTQRAIGVFTSGPETLKRAVEVAVAHIDATAFDLREEQFEL